mgnify:CR=1 FL=1
MIEKCNKDVLKTSAPIDTLCDNSHDNNKEITEVREIINVMRTKYKREADLAMFLLETGCRISEALEITYKDIDALGRVKIKSKKGSKTRIVFSPSCLQLFLQARAYKSEIFERFNRFHIYRVFKQAGLGRIFGENRNMSITHYFRHLNAIIAAEIADEKSNIAEVLGHKAEKNTDFYLKTQHKTASR